MKLKTIYFHAYKSLLEKELLINHECIGIVGTNESGKSNILSAINILGGHKKLTTTDTPKMASDTKPYISFKFELDEKEKKDLSRIVSDWEKEYSIVTNGFTYDENYISYDIMLSKENTEIRFFNFCNLALKSGYNVLNQCDIDDPVNIRIEGKAIPISKAVIVRDADLSDYMSIMKTLEVLSQHQQTIEIESAWIKEQESRIPETAKDSVPDIESNEEEILDTKASSEFLKRKKALSKLELEKEQLENTIKEFNIPEQIKKYQEEIVIKETELLAKNNEKKAVQEKIGQLNSLAALNDAQTKELATATSELASLEIKIKALIEATQRLKNLKSYIEVPVPEKYSKNIEELQIHFEDSLLSHFENLIPKVVFWEHSNQYILESEILFSEILAKQNLADISRPLVNVFRIGLGINTVEELKSKITQIQSQPNERSKLEQVLNKKINVFIKSVWENYDQSMKLTLEKDQIRIEIYDPVGEQASYYNMEERSQGCQTFLSFLMTIGAEAEHGVITNTILLLDEPETHLHPSGVRFMLKELIKISDKGNLVMYATHSIFLIDRMNFDRHIILEKKKEHTYIKPANIGRIGYFMQEEVLYNTLDLNLGKDLTSTNKFNFVFEGDGDVNLFQHFYDNILTKEGRPFPTDQCSFYQGGKCSDIQKYLIQRPIQLGSIWVFILDKDKPADDLKKFIEGKYKKYIGTDIFIYQYDNQAKKGKDKNIELEDLLPTEVIQSVYLKVFERLKHDIDSKEIKKVVNDEELYAKYDEIILKTYVHIDHQNDFKAFFKEELNDIIKSDLLVFTKAENFSEKYDIYTKFANTLISDIIDKTKPKA